MRLPAVIAAALCATLALLSGGQAASSALAKSNPVLASALSPYAAQAEAEIAEQLFLKGSIETARQLASHAIATDPLNGANLALAAQNMESAERKAQLLKAASRVTKRSTLLQGLLLQHYADEEDLQGMAAALDRVLTVYPRLSSSVMPVFVGILERDGAVPVLAGLLKDDPSWNEAFFKAALDRSDLLDPLIALRRNLGASADSTLDFDRQFIRLLIAEDRFSDARSYYRTAVRDQGGASTPAIEGQLDWRRDIPPFDWDLSDDPDEYARYDASKDAIRISLRSGHGGEVARRLLSPVTPIRSVMVNHDFKQNTRAGEGVRLALYCNADKIPLASEMLAQSPTSLNIDNAKSCERYDLVITGRAWSGSKDVNGTIRDIIITEIGPR